MSKKIENSAIAGAANKRKREAALNEASRHLAEAMVLIDQVGEGHSIAACHLQTAIDLLTSDTKPPSVARLDDETAAAPRTQ